MAKRKAKPTEKKEFLEYARITVFHEGDDDEGRSATARLEYKIKGRKVPGSQDHDEDVHDFTDDDLRKLFRQILDVDKDDPVDIEVNHD